MNNISLIEEKEAVQRARKSFGTPLILCLLLNACTTLPHQVNKQYLTLSAALTHERQLNSATDEKAVILARKAQSDLHGNPSQNLKEVEAEIAQIESVLAINSASDSAAKKQTDSALSKLDKTATSAANLAQKESANSSYFGLPGLINYAGQVFKNSLLILLLVAIICAALYIASYFFPVLGPIVNRSESILISLIAQIQKLKR